MYSKAQDLSLRAVDTMQDRHDDAWLVTACGNPWEPSSNYPMLRHNRRTVHLPLGDQKMLSHWMNQTDVGLFPNRVEGGTNLVLMEYMACGKPVIASATTGQKDVLQGVGLHCNSDNDDERVEQMLAHLEMLYAHREALPAMGEQSRAAMREWSWERTARALMSLAGINEELAA